MGTSVLLRVEGVAVGSAVVLIGSAGWRGRLPVTQAPGLASG